MYCYNETFNGLKIHEEKKIIQYTAEKGKIKIGDKTESLATANIISRTYGIIVHINGNV